MLGFLFGLGIGSMLSHSDSSNSGNKNQVEVFRFEIGLPQSNWL